MASVQHIQGSAPLSPSEGIEKQKERLKQACMDFESLLTAQLVKSMRAAVLRDEEPNHAMEVYEAMLDEKLAQVWSHEGSLGIGQWLYQSLEPLITAEEQKTVFSTKTLKDFEENADKKV